MACSVSHDRANNQLDLTRCHSHTRRYTPGFDYYVVRGLVAARFVNECASTHTHTHAHRPKWARPNRVAQQHDLARIRRRYFRVRLSHLVAGADWPDYDYRVHRIDESTVIVVVKSRITRRHTRTKPNKYTYMCHREPPANKKQVVEPRTGAHIQHILGLTHTRKTL